jgi:hypothetical protein
MPALSDFSSGFSGDPSIDAAVTLSSAFARSRVYLHSISDVSLLSVDARSRRRYLVVFRTNDGRWYSAESIGVQLVQRLRHENDAVRRTKTPARTNWPGRLVVYGTVIRDDARVDRNISVFVKWLIDRKDLANAVLGNLRMICANFELGASLVNTQISL